MVLAAKMMSDLCLPCRCYHLHHESDDESDVGDDNYDVHGDHDQMMLQSVLLLNCCPLQNEN